MSANRLPSTAAATVFNTPFSGCVNFANSDPCSMFSMKMVPKINGMGTVTMNATASIFITSTPM